MPEPPQLDLDVPRGAEDLIATTLRLFARHSGLFLSLTLLVVAPVVILVDGVWGRGLVDGASADVSTTPATVSAALGFLIPVLVTALHVVVVRDLGDGRVPTVGDALRPVGSRLAPAVVSVLIYTVLFFGGCILFLIPGIWVFVAGYFVAQTAVIERRGRRTAGTLLFGMVVFGVVFFAIRLAVGFVDNGVAYISLLTVVQALDQSLTALFGTLMYFSLRARKEHPFPSVPAPA